MTSNSISPSRLLALLLGTALLASLALGAGSATAAKAKKCPKGKTAWKLDGRTACVASRALGASGGDGAAAPTLAQAWLAAASRPVPGSRVRIAPSLRRVAPRVGRGLARTLTRAGKKGKGARISQRGPVVERIGEVLGRQELGDGIVAESRVRGRIYEDGVREYDSEIEVRDRRGNAVRYSPSVQDLGQPAEPVGCPTAAGLVRTKSASSTGGTVTALRGGRVAGAKTDQTTWRVDARGQVGTDARLQSVASDVTMTFKQFQRGLQAEMTLTAAVTQTREGAPRIGGTPKVDVRIRSAALSPAQERAAEAEWARGMASSPDIARAIGKVADTARWRLLQSEYVWYDLPNYCAQIDWSPGSGAMVEPGETKRVTGHVVSKRDGGLASGAIELTAVTRGRLIPITKAFVPGAPASFIAAGGEPDADRTTVAASAIATSTAGRVQGGWYADGTPARLPQTFQGTVSSTATGGGLTREFSGSATYTRTSLTRGPDGSLNAWYELTSASLAEAKETLGPTAGCRWEAEGSGGYVDSGDLELRVLPGGEVVYGIHYDLKVASVFAPTDCPPNSGDPWDGEISAFLDSRRPGPADAALRPAGADFQLVEDGVTDVTVEPGMTSSASWSLLPGES
jgi:hypothetical protein